MCLVFMCDVAQRNPAVFSNRSSKAALVAIRPVTAYRTKTSGSYKRSYGSGTSMSQFEPTESSSFGLPWFLHDGGERLCRLSGPAPRFCPFPLWPSHCLLRCPYASMAVLDGGSCSPPCIGEAKSPRGVKKSVK